MSPPEQPRMTDQVFGELAITITNQFVAISVTGR